MPATSNSAIVARRAKTRVLFMNELSLGIIEVLRKLGFVRVDGISYGSPPTIIQARLEERGRWSTNNSMLACVSMEGHVFCGSMDILYKEGFEEIVSLLCPHGEGGVFVPFSNGEKCSLPCLFARIAETPIPSRQSS